MLAVNTYRRADRVGTFITRFHDILMQILAEAENAHAHSGGDGRSPDIPVWTGAEVQGERVHLTSLPGFAVYWRRQPQPDNYLASTRARGTISLELVWDKKREDVPRSQIDLENLAQSVIQGLRVPQRRQRLGLRHMRPTTSLAGERDAGTSENPVPILTHRLDIEVEIQ